MNWKSLNLPISGVIEHVEFSYDEDGCYSFQKDISVGKWTISRFIRLCGPKTSIYKYDFNNYFEFGIIDSVGESRLLRWYHNGGDEILKAYTDRDSAIESLPFFIQNHPIFRCENWAEYDCEEKLIKIIHILNSGRGSKEKISEIKKIIN